MLMGLLIVILASVNLGGIFSMVMQVGRGDWLAGVGSLLFLAVLDVVGFWIVRALREET
ncbi:hypothetical protein HNQ07_002632 [Deinococcus metalli]|uniref:Uncharacterized protein n=1 Tax=Deinococcus metalli TaxID=1141878 RepID=A0A7W8KIJ1_9DEIO|nr:hypothetical protein [Deinococcus metalli]MBB5377159.1 hypothetical protein [Deinococcus metalli]GHF48546.1 hypothetical protein GCM10017781_26160 [Deinococcus metalli]